MPVVPTQYVMSTKRARRSRSAKKPAETLLADGPLLEAGEIGIWSSAARHVASERREERLIRCEMDRIS